MNTITLKNGPPRRGAIAVTVGLLLVVIVGMVAYAFDTGWIALTRVQLHAAADSGALAGGTELMPGLGFNQTATPDEVRAAATVAAIEFAGRNPGGDRGSCYCDGGRDVIMGTAIFDPDAGQWVKTPGATPYNYVQANLHRDQEGSTAGDGLLPLFFARIFAIPDTAVSAYATAVILPASGFFIEEGSDDTVGLLPFAFREEVWRRFEAAHQYYNGETVHPDYSAQEIQNLVNNPPNQDERLADSALGAVTDPGTGVPLFGETYVETQGNTEVTKFHQLFYNEYAVNEGVVTDGPDSQLEVDIYPHRAPDPDSEGGEGNFGTVDFGSTDNSTQTLKRQITEGLNADDFSYYEDNQITISEEDPLDAEGDTGISGGIESGLRSILGDCRAIALFSASNSGSGNNFVYTLVEIVGVTIVEVELGSNNKRLYLQRCKFVDDNVVADIDEEIGENTTVFTPLILIE
jgi:hypothetical protein